jgi:hypothetical protein
MDKLCPREILLKGVPFKSVPFLISEKINKKIGGFESVVSFSRFDVYVMPLLCKEICLPYCVDCEDGEEIPEFKEKLFDPKASKYACKSGFDMAYLYIRMVRTKKHYIVAFINCGKLQEIDALVVRLCETAKWLTILDKCPVFYVYYYGKQDKELGKEKADALVLENIKRKMNREIKNCVKYENKDKNVFFTNTLPSNPEELKKFVIMDVQNEIWFNPGFSNL